MGGASITGAKRLRLGGSRRNSGTAIRIASRAKCPAMLMNTAFLRDSVYSSDLNSWSGCDTIQNYVAFFRLDDLCAAFYQIRSPVGTFFTRRRRGLYARVSFSASYFRSRLWRR